MKTGVVHDVKVKIDSFFNYVVEKLKSFHNKMKELFGSGTAIVYVIAGTMISGLFFGAEFATAVLTLILFTGLYVMLFVYFLELFTKNSEVNIS